MINNLRVGIPVIGGKGWLGGVSHMELHVKAVTSVPKNERPQLFLIVTEDSLDGLECYRTFAALFDGIIFMGSALHMAKMVLGLPAISAATWDDVFAKIDFLFPVSFNVMPGRPAASWIHDFQHKYLPEFFSAQDIELRDMLCARIASESHLVFCSSRAVEQDFWRFYPKSQAITRVLPLRVSPEAAWFASDPIEIQQKYQLPDRFIVCSNQFWIHKNHRLLLEAISLLHKAGNKVHLVCTGLTSDFRCPDYMSDLNQYIKELGIADHVHILGQIPRHDQIQLIRRSLFVVQPSLFEGLSLIVQECRALGKPIVLSDLEVHLEHEYGIYFKRTDAEDLAAKISSLLDVAQPGPDIARETEAKLQASGLTAGYSRQFSRMVEEASKLFSKQPDEPTVPLINASNSDVLIATSLILTSDIARQIQAVQSWLAAGFKVVSLNRPQDITLLKADFPEVTFVPVVRDAQEAFRSPYVYFDDIVGYLDQTTAEICGIIEPDVRLYGKDLASHIAKEAGNCLVYQPRQDIESVHALAGKAFPELGVIFFDRQLIKCYPHENFCIGFPWWDYWAILIPLISKIPVKRITTPFAYHITHAEQYDINGMLTLGNVLIKYAPPPFELSTDTLAKYQHILIQILSNHSIDVALYGLRECGNS